MLVHTAQKSFWCQLQAHATHDFGSCRFPFGLEPLHVHANNNLGALSRKATQACTQQGQDRGCGFDTQLDLSSVEMGPHTDSPFCAEKANSRLSGSGALSDKLSVACCCWGHTKGYTCARGILQKGAKTKGIANLQPSTDMVVFV